MKKTLLIICLLILRLAAIACPACEKKQPKILAGITHGAGPDSNWDYVIVWATVLIVLATLFYTIKWLIKPGENSYDHIKRTVLN
jgi:phage shock protein PspC (stress-responsive transcriptional regulator)